jgi:hypothetical protein
MTILDDVRVRAGYPLQVANLRVVGNLRKGFG